jgi:alkylhydroperoxidase family enzyme
MAHIQLPEGVPGIIGLLMTYRDTEPHLNSLAQAALRGPSSLSAAERETIAANVSKRNDCVF